MMIDIKQIYDGFLNIIGNSKVQFALAVVIIPIGSFLLMNNSKCLSYSTSIPEKLNVLDDSKYIETNNIGDSFEFKQVLISIYNDGNGHIDNIDFINAKQIAIQNTGKVYVIEVHTIKTKRKNFPVRTKVDSANREKVYVNIVGNEVFEEDDAVVLNISYKEISEGSWTVKSRIKGITNGMSKGGIHPKEGNVLKVLGIIWIILILIILFRIILFRIYRKKFVFRKFELFFITGLLFFTSLICYEYYQHKTLIDFVLV